jgi:ParB family chromosome partitioning protein
VDEEELAGLGESLKDFGALQPIVVAYDDRKRKFRLVVGERRYRAAKDAGLKEILALCLNGVGRQDELVMRLVENMQRSPLTSIEEARGMGELRDRFGLSEDQIARKLGKNRRLVRERLELLDLPDPIKMDVHEGKLPAGAALHIKQMKGGEEKKIAAAKVAVEQRVPTDVVKEIVDQIGRATAPPLKTPKPKVEKKEGAPLSRQEMSLEVETIRVAAKALANRLQRIPLHRWDAQGKVELRLVVEQIEESMRLFLASRLRR